MKTCPHCGEANADSATQCSKCAGDLAVAASADESFISWEQVAVLDNEAEAERLVLELENRQVPHVMVSYRDSALDGLFQFSHGWGHVEAPPEHKETVLSILHDIRKAASEPDPDGDSNILN